MLLLLLAGAGKFYAQNPQQKLEKKTRVLFLLDASGSMLAPWNEGLRIHVAKRQLAEIVNSLRTNDNLEIALRVYGHQYHRRFRNCQDSELLVPFAQNNHDKIIAALRDIKPMGTTPIAYSLEQAGNDFPTAENVKNVVIIITDGIESCKGDPCQVSKSLQNKKVFLKPFIIGLDMDKKFKQMFDCVGDYQDAKDETKFRSVLNRIVNQNLKKTTVSIDLLDIHNQPTETNVNVSFFDEYSKSLMYEFVHYKNSNKEPDKVEVESTLTYSVWVNTVPPVVKRNVKLKWGEHNVLTLKVPQGKLTLRMHNSTEYRKGVEALVSKNGSTIHNQQIGKTQAYLVGKYMVEILTTPRLTYPVEIKQSENTVLNIPTPGNLRIKCAFKGHGSLYRILPNGGQEWIYDISDDEISFNIPMQPGKYKIVFRSDKALSSEHTQIKSFSIRSNATTEVKLNY